MSTESQQFLTPVGRLVQGSPFEKQEKNMAGQPLMTKAGTPTQRYFVAVAFPKLNAQGQPDPVFGAFYQLMVNEAKRSFPNLFDATGRCVHPGFSWKLIDGDSTLPDQSGKAPNTKEGFPGHWVVRFQSSFPPKCFYAGRYEPHMQIQDPNAIRRGYYVRVSGTMEGNGDAGKPGLYVNLNMVELAAQGVEIVSGPDAAAVFGGAGAPVLPAGATPLPGAGAPVGLPGAVPGAQAAVPGLPGMPAAGMPIPGAAPVVVQPNPGFATGLPPGAPAGLPPGPPAGPQLTAAALSIAPNVTLAQWLAPGSNWTEATMRQAGYLV
jgi:hypothetical protein